MGWQNGFLTGFGYGKWDKIGLGRACFFRMVHIKNMQCIIFEKSGADNDRLIQMLKSLMLIMKYSGHCPSQLSASEFTPFIIIQQNLMRKSWCPCSRNFSASIPKGRQITIRGRRKAYEAINLKEEYVKVHYKPETGVLHINWKYLFDDNVNLVIYFLH
ncbi:MAG: hypothetical protein B6245_00015 [Desulfobacteraceae bacterium 4572_88]|nr:MAG: hypothetical protein B6245_00015 [Desulfobacteraceae bacterium 4572_88]